MRLVKLLVLLNLIIIILLIIRRIQIENFIILQKIHKSKKNNTKKIKIPLHIWQTHKSNDLPDSSYHHINRLIKSNPEFTHQFFTNEDMRNYMKDNFGNDVLKAYDKINPGAGKADIWRLAVILKEGGIYIDVDKILIDNAKPFIDIIDENDELIHGRNWHIWGTDAPATNATLCAIPNHPVIKMAFESVIDAILNDKPLTHIGEHKGWAKLEDYTGTPHLWKALSHYTGNINLKEGRFDHGIQISNKIEDILTQNPKYGDDLKELKVKHWTAQEVFAKEGFSNSITSPKIAVCMWYDDNIKDYGDITYKINKHYCNKYNMDLIKSSEINMPDRNPQWERYPLLLDSLNTNKYDYVMWIDADACFNLESKTNIRDLILKYPDKDIIFSKDCSAWKNVWDINSGVLILKNNNYTKHMLKYWINNKECFSNGKFLKNDQQCLRWSIQHNYNNINDHSIIIPFGKIQIFSTDKNNKDTLIFHLAGTSSRGTIFNNLYKYYLNKKIVTDNDNDNSFPKIIHQIFWDFSGKNRTINEIPEYNACSNSWKNNHPDWEYKLWYGTEMHQYVKTNFPQFYNIWDNLPKKIMKVDSFRYMLMYKIGGLYSDLDQESTKSMNNFIKENDKYDIVLWCDGHPSCHNGLILSKPNIFWLKYLEDIMNKKDKSDILNLTGPPSLYIFYNKNKNIANIKTYYPRKTHNDQHYMMRRGDGINSCLKKINYDNSQEYLVSNWDKTPNDIHWLRGKLD
jgi:mannosyltransferase OCH1-like enzyme